MQRISFDPKTPKQGQQLQICYDFAGTGLESTRLRVTFGTDETEYEVTPAANCIEIQVPADATEIRVEDVDGPSPDKTSAVEPN